MEAGYRVFDFSLSALQFVGRGNACTDWLSRIGRLDEVVDAPGAHRPARQYRGAPHVRSRRDARRPRPTAKGCRFYKGAVRVPLAISWPGRFRQGLVAYSLVELNHVAPTLAELTREPLASTKGQSLLPILTGEADPARHHGDVRREHYDAWTCTCRRSRAVTRWAGPPCTVTSVTS